MRLAALIHGTWCRWGASRTRSWCSPRPVRSPKLILAGDSNGVGTREMTCFGWEGGLLTWPTCPVRNTTSSNCGTICPGPKVPSEPPFFPVGQELQNGRTLEIMSCISEHFPFHCVDFRKQLNPPWMYLFVFATFWNCWGKTTIHQSESEIKIQAPELYYDWYLNKSIRGAENSSFQ
jgi:hypothetical protein